MSSEEDKMKAFKEQLLSVWDDEKSTGKAEADVGCKNGERSHVLEGR